MLTSYLKLFKEKRFYPYIGVCVSASIFLLFFYSKTTTVEPLAIKELNKEITTSSARHTNELSSLGSSISNISFKLNKIESQLSKPAVNIEPIQHQISNLVHETEMLSSNSHELINKSINTATVDLKEKLSGIELELKNLKDKQNKETYISEKYLPFNILHIDNIQGNNFTTIRYNNTILPLSEGDYLAGWKLIKTEFSKQKAEFINDNNERVLVSLNFNNSTGDIG